jgi:hypothetical protein
MNSKEHTWNTIVLLSVIIRGRVFFCTRVIRSSLLLSFQAVQKVLYRQLCLCKFSDDLSGTYTSVWPGVIVENQHFWKYCDTYMTKASIRTSYDFCRAVRVYCCSPRQEIQANTALPLPKACSNDFLY